MSSPAWLTKVLLCSEHAATKQHWKKYKWVIDSHWFNKIKTDDSLILLARWIKYLLDRLPVMFIDDSVFLCHIMRGKFLYKIWVASVFFLIICPPLQKLISLLIRCLYRLRDIFKSVSHLSVYPWFFAKTAVKLQNYQIWYFKVFMESICWDAFIYTLKAKSKSWLAEKKNMHIIKMKTKTCEKSLWYQ